jgi:predicted DNA-binding transcriptional regulator YafY
MVEPHRLVTVGRRWYLVAWDLDREDWRTFRVDRLGDPRSVRHRFVPREIPGGDAAAFVQAQLSAFATRYEVEAVVDADLATVERVVLGWGTVEDLGDGACRLRMSVDALEWPMVVLAAVGAPFRVVSPPELRAYVAETGRRFTAAALAEPAG